jgi:hypothetical protein
MLLDFFEYSELLNECQIDETFDRIQLKLETDKPTKPLVNKLFDELKSISNRDSFELILDIQGTTESISDTCLTSNKKLTSFLELNDVESDCIEIDLTINKRLNNSTLSIYFIEAFASYLSEELIKNSLETFNKYFNNTLAFEVFSTINPFYSSSIAFYSSGSEPQSQLEITGNRLKLIESFNDNCTSFNLDLGFLPTDFDLIKCSNNSIINSYFDKVCGLLSIAFISNSFQLISNDKSSYKISGYKTVNCEGINNLELADNKELLHKIFVWCYEGGNNSDKIGLARNVLSIHTDRNDCIKFDSEVWFAINSNYKIYLKDNIQSYLNIKNKISEFVIESTTKTHSLVEDIVDSFKNSIVVILTFLLTVIIVNGIKGAGIDKIFSVTYFWIVIIICVLSWIWMRMLESELLNRYEKSTETIKEILTINYSKVLMQAEIDECMDPAIKKNKTFLKDQISRYTKWWKRLLLSLVFLFGIGVTINHVITLKVQVVTEDNLPTEAQAIEKDNNIKDSGVKSKTNDDKPTRDLTTPD